jgi:hypothetical protein
MQCEAHARTQRVVVQTATALLAMTSWMVRRLPQTSQYPGSRRSVSGVSDFGELIAGLKAEIGAVTLKPLAFTA